MKLSLINEATLEDVQRRINIWLGKYFKQIPQEKAIKIIELSAAADPTKGKYTEWIIRQLISNKIRLPEDGYRVKETITNFDRLKNRLPEKDISKYDKLSDIEDIIDNLLNVGSKKEDSDRSNTSNMPGVEQVLRKGPYSIVEVTDVESLKDLGEGTKWCTRRSYPECQAENYLHDFDMLYIIFKDGKPFIQFTPDYEQMMDVNDNEVDDEIKYKIVDMMEQMTGVGIVDDPGLSYGYAHDVIKGRFPEGEPVIAKDPSYAYHYAKNVIKDSFPEGEPAMARDIGIAFAYARDIIKDRSSVIESAIARSSHYACLYAKHIIKGRFPEGEPAIIENAENSYLYARDVIHGRFPEAETKIAQYAKYAYLYARDVINGRFPEGEPVMAQHAAYSYEYAKNVIKGRFLEGESSIKSDPAFFRTYKTMVTMLGDNTYK